MNDPQSGENEIATAQTAQCGVTFPANRRPHESTACSPDAGRGRRARLQVTDASFANCVRPPCSPHTAPARVRDGARLRVTAPRFVRQLDNFDQRRSCVDHACNYACDRARTHVPELRGILRLPSRRGAPSRCSLPLAPRRDRASLVCSAVPPFCSGPTRANQSPRNAIRALTSPTCPRGPRATRRGCSVGSCTRPAYRLRRSRPPRIRSEGWRLW